MLGGVTEELNGHTQAVIFYEESLALSRVLENQWDIAAVLCNLGYVIALRGNYTRAITYLEESLALSRKVDDKDGIADALTKLGMVHHFLGDYQKANTLLKEGLALAREVGDKWLVAIALQFLSDVSLNQGNNAQALALSEQGLIYEREIENKNNIARLHRILGVVWLHQGEHAQASEFLRKSLALAWEIEDKVVTTESLEALAEAAIKQEQPRRAAQLCGAAEALRTAIHTPLPPGRYLPYDRTISAARTQLGEAAFNIAWAEGRTLSLEQIIAKALVPAPMPEPTPIVATTAQPTYPAGLTKREVEVLSLIAAGFTTAQVAEQIVISPRTVSSHLESIYSKLGVHSRSAATRFATEHGLV
jgi:ATP/maltotriose-dependent transcriptional regulator MalT